MKQLLAPFVLGTTLALSAGEPAPPPAATPAPTAPAAPTTPASAEPQVPALYVRAGGLERAGLVADELLERLTAREGFNAAEPLKKALAGLPRGVLRYHLTSLLAQSAGGPERYSGPNLFELYKHFKPAPADWTAFDAAVKEALAAGKVAPAEAAEWQQQLASIRTLLERMEATEPIDYRQSELGFAIAYPRNWERKENTAGAAVVAFSPADGEDDKFQENVAVQVEDLPTELTPAEYAKARALAARTLTAFALTDLAPVNLNGLEGHRVSYSHKMGERELRTITLCYVRARRAYAVTCTADAAALSRWQPAFEAICLTFRLLPLPGATPPASTTAPANPTVPGTPAAPATPAPRN